MQDIKKSLIEEINKRVQDKILEPANAKLLIKLINNAESSDEAINIAALGTTYKRTGLHFDKRLEKMTDSIKYFKKNEKLSFHTDDAKPVNKLIIGDNYQALQNLLIQYKGQIDVIYIDPPYGKDSMGEFAKTNYTNAITRDNLLSMLYPRLILAKQLLSDEGVIFCSIDDKNQAYVKCLFDEVFGEENFVGNMIWKCRNSLQHEEPLVSTQTEFILLYVKNKKNWNNESGRKFTRIRKPFDATEYKNPDNDPRGPWLSSGKTRNDGRPSYTVISPTGVKFTKPWIPSQEEFKKWEKENLIWWGENGNSIPRKKSFLKDFKGNAISNILFDEYIDEVKGENNLKRTKTWEIGTTESGTKLLKAIFNDESLFGYPKPHTLIKYLIQISSKPNSLILDFFAGSGTTGHAVLDLNKTDGGNRTFILCQINEKTEENPNGIAYDVTSKRLKRIMTGECYDGTKDFPWLKDNEPYGGNLDVYEIESVANFENTPEKSPFDVIDETLYGKDKFKTVKEKIDWVCSNFEKTQKELGE